MKLSFQWALKGTVGENRGKEELIKKATKIPQEENKFQRGVCFTSSFLLAKNESYIDLIVGTSLGSRVYQSGKVADDSDQDTIWK